jgi:hypothetical protein
VTVTVFTTAYRKVAETRLPEAARLAGFVGLSMRDLKEKRLANGLYHVRIASSQGETLCKWLILR